MRKEIITSPLRYSIRDRETGTVIEEANTFFEVSHTIEEYEKYDKDEGIYTLNFYEIFDNVYKKIIT